MGDTVMMEEMTWPQIKDAITSGKDTVLFACGAVEQHGPHLPTGTDTMVGTAIAQRAAEKLGNALVAPTLRPGCSEHHMGFPGTVTLRFETFVMVLEDYCASLAKHGFRNIFMFSSHGGNTDIMLAHLPAIAKRLADEAFVFMAGSLFDGIKRQGDFLSERGVGRAQAGVHSGYAETSEMLAIHPKLVDLEAAAPGLTDEAFYAPERLRLSALESYTRGVHNQSANGVLGDPSGANPEIGEELLELRSDEIARHIEAALGEVSS